MTAHFAFRSHPLPKIFHLICTRREFWPDLPHSAKNISSRHARRSGKPGPVSFVLPRFIRCSFVTIPVIPTRKLSIQTLFHLDRPQSIKDGSFVPTFQARPKLFSRVPWQLRKTRHLARNSNDGRTFSKIFTAVCRQTSKHLKSVTFQLTIDGRLAQKFQANRKQFRDSAFIPCRALLFLPFSTVIYSCPSISS